MNATENYDVVIIGGGIQGAGVAQVCALNKLKVLLLEQDTVAAHTSSKSSKLIHGGLRYLESWQWGLVRECLRERKILLDIAPELVKLVPFYIPVYSHTSRSSLIIRLGLSLYALLGGFRKECRFKKLARSKWYDLQGLTVEKLKAVYQYYDAQTDDRLLTQAVIKSAIEQGADIKEHSSFLQAGNDSLALDIKYSTVTENEQVSHCKAKLIVNAAGPWVNQVLSKFSPKLSQHAIELVQGAHIIVRYSLKKIFYLESAQDRRAIFAMPWKGNTLIGTTETQYSSDPQEVKPLDEEIEYLQKIFCDYFPSAKNAEVLESFAGLRVLPAAGSDVFNKSRDSTIVCDNGETPRVISIFGGKLTSYRHNAELVFKIIAKTLGRPASEYVSTKKTGLGKN